jgi:hypothetical protein
MTKIVYNQCYGGFSLSDEAIHRYVELKGNGAKLVEGTSVWELPDGEWFEHREIDRQDPVLVQVVEELGEDANGRCAQLAIYELPAGTLYRIEEYDGMEHIETVETIKWKVA